MKVKCLIDGCNNHIKISFKKWLYYKLYRYGDICHDLDHSLDKDFDNAVAYSWDSWDSELDKLEEELDKLK